MPPLYPSLYQVNTRLLMTGLGRSLGRPATLDDWPDADLDRLAGLGFDWVWLLGWWARAPSSPRPPPRPSRAGPHRGGCPAAARGGGGRWPGSGKRPPPAATACAATWPCWCCPRCSAAPGRTRPRRPAAPPRWTPRSG